MIQPRLNFPLFALAISAKSASLAQAPAPVDHQLPFAHPHHMVDIGGRRMNLYCSGTGPLTVVFDSPSGDAGFSWIQVQPALAMQTRACIYDRAGLGFSDPSPRPGTVGNAVDDLHKLLGAAGIAPPYVLVGNSYGGATAQLYAYRYPAEVKGLVLVEPHHEDEAARAAAATQGKSRQMQAVGDQMEKACAEQAQRGFAPGSEMLMNCTGGIQTSFGRAFAAAHLAMNLSPAYWRARLSENDNFDTSDAELRAARRSFGDLPLLVLSRTVSPFAVPNQPQSALNKAYENVNLTLNREVAALSTRGSLRLVPRAGHIIQADQPQAVIDAVKEVLAQAMP